MITLELHVPTFKLGAIDIAAIKLHSEENDSKDLLQQFSLSISSAEPLEYIQCFKPSPLYILKRKDLLIGQTMFKVRRQK